MKMIIEGREYRLVDHNTAHVLHLIELQQQARGLVDGGLGMAGLQRIEREASAYHRALAAYQKAVKDGDTSAQEPEIPDTGLIGMAAAVFLTRRSAGDQVTFVDSMRIGLSAVIQVPEPGDQAAAEAPDPTTPAPGSPETPGAGDAPAATPSRPTRSRTSKPRSGSGSRS